MACWWWVTLLRRQPYTITCLSLMRSMEPLRNPFDMGRNIRTITLFTQETYFLDLRLAVPTQDLHIL